MMLAIFIILFLTFIWNMNKLLRKIHRLRNYMYAQTFLGQHFVLLHNLERYFKKTNKKQ